MMKLRVANRDISLPGLAIIGDPYESLEAVPAVLMNGPAMIMRRIIMGSRLEPQNKFDLIPIDIGNPRDVFCSVKRGWLFSLLRLSPFFLCSSLPELFPAAVRL